MSNSLTPTTELEAVNTMLEVIGESPIASLNVTGVLDAELARNILHRTSRTVQAEGWHWNKEVDFPIAPDVDGNINVPPNALEIERSYRNNWEELVQRGTRMYNVRKQTYTFDSTEKFNWTQFLAFTDLPETARRYITIKAARIFQQRMLMSDTVDGYTEEEQLEARAALEQAEHRTNNPNIISGSYSTSRIVNREGY